ncbi:MAG: hypothetical protein Q8P15_01190 [Nanoarchaeota archaeon]|nr:hypothetical protein [Nanoarchaeota archaeon]
MKKRGALNLSFGMIFSIFLIIFFLGFAFYIIPKFLGFQDDAKIGSFVNDFQNDVNKMWKSTKGSQVVEYSLPKKVSEICFDEKSRIYFNPFGSGGNFDYSETEHLDVQSDSCFEVVDGKISMTIKKDFGEVLVRVE